MVRFVYNRFRHADVVHCRTPASQAGEAGSIPVICCYPPLASGIAAFAVPDAFCVMKNKVSYDTMALWIGAQLFVLTPTSPHTPASPGVTWQRLTQNVQKGTVQTLHSHCAQILFSPYFVSKPIPKTASSSSPLFHHNTRKSSPRFPCPSSG